MEIKKYEYNIDFYDQKESEFRIKSEIINKDDQVNIMVNQNNYINKQLKYIQDNHFDINNILEYNNKLVDNLNNKVEKRKLDISEKNIDDEKECQ